MFHCLFLLLILISPAFAETYYLAPDGSDNNPGGKAAPFASLQRAQEAASPGDTIFLRGGTYRISEDWISRKARGQAHVIILDKSGEPEKPIRYHAYSDEKPVFDFSDVKPRGLRIYALHVTGSWLHFKGFSVTGVQVTLTGHTQSISFENHGSHNIYEQLEARDSQAIGFWLGRGSHNLVLNCDAYRNFDHTSGDKLGGNVDGFGYHGGKGTAGNRFVGCRAWFNSDDGFDFITAQESATIENCWAFYNGYGTGFESLGDGNGFKVGGYGAIAGGRLPETVPRHVVTGSIAARNRASGFYANHHPGGVDWLHNTAFRNRHNFNMLGRNDANTASVPGRDHLLKNNLSHRGGTNITQLAPEGNELSGNSFQHDVDSSDGDFLSINERELTAPRQADGSLPEVDFMRPRPSSPWAGMGPSATNAE